jgi:MoaA/NifB/PqqE/SkfB family radical SAM enzyme
MNKKILSNLESIYISPLEGCNLACKYCYTHKTGDVLSNQQILDFVDQYNLYFDKNSADAFFSSIQRATHIGRLEKKRVKEFSNKIKLKSIILCGGEVFLLPDFPQLVNTLIDKDIFITIITNGTIDRLGEIRNPDSCQILVSLDGPKDIHDQNRGSGNFDKSIKYIKHAQKLGFPIGIMFLVTKDSYPYKDTFLDYLKTEYGIKNIELTYLTDRKMSLTNDQCLDIKLHYPTFPAKNFGCYQLSLQSNGNITGCCESSISLGKITDDPQIYISKFINSLSKCSNCKISTLNNSLKIVNCKLKNKCNGCTDPSYLCGYPQEFHQKSCQGIIKLINK